MLGQPPVPAPMPCVGVKAICTLSEFVGLEGLPLELGGGLLVAPLPKLNLPASSLG